MKIYSAFSIFLYTLILGAMAVLFLQYKHKPQCFNKTHPHIDRIIVHKKNRTLETYHGKTRLKIYTIALGFSPIGHKECEGDGKTPEGTYAIVYKNPNSRFHLSLKIDYPQNADTLHAKEKGCHPGSNIMIHGLGRWFIFYPRYDWTAGCMAVSNAEIEEIYCGSSLNTKVVILP